MNECVERTETTISGWNSASKRVPMLPWPCGCRFIGSLLQVDILVVLLDATSGCLHTELHAQAAYCTGCHTFLFWLCLCRSCACCWDMLSSYCSVTCLTTSHPHATNREYACALTTHIKTYHPQAQQTPWDCDESFQLFDPDPTSVQHQLPWLAGASQNCTCARHQQQHTTTWPTSACSRVSPSAGCHPSSPWRCERSPNSRQSVVFVAEGLCRTQLNKLSVSQAAQCTRQVGVAEVILLGFPLTHLVWLHHIQVVSLRHTSAPDCCTQASQQRSSN